MTASTDDWAGLALAAARRVVEEWQHPSDALDGAELATRLDVLAAALEAHRTAPSDVLSAGARADCLHGRRFDLCVLCRGQLVLVPDPEDTG